MRSLLVASQKGGVGKTTTAINLAALAGAAGARVLLLDADPLGSVAASLRLARDPSESAAPPRPDPVTGAGTLWPGAAPGVDVVAPYPASDTAERHLQAFLDALPKSPATRAYDLVIIDAPPMLGPRPKALLRATPEVLVVQRAEPMSIRTLPAYLDLVQQVRSEGGQCRLRGVLLTIPEGSTAATSGEALLRAKFPGVLPQTVPFDPEVARALILGRPLVVANPNSVAARAYTSLANSLGLLATRAPAVAVAAGAVAVGATAGTRAPRVAPKPPVNAARTTKPSPGTSRPDDTPAPRVVHTLPEPQKENPLALPPESKADNDSPSAWLVALASVMVLAVIVLGLFVAFRK